MLRVDFNKIQAKYYFDCVDGDEPIQPPDGGWNRDALIMLAAACYISPERGTCVDAPQHAEHHEAEVEAFECELLGAIQYFGGLTGAIFHDQYDKKFDEQVAIVVRGTDPNDTTVTPILGVRGNAQTVEGFAKNVTASSMNRELTRKLANASMHVMPIAKMDRASFAHFAEWATLAEVGEQVLGRVLAGRLIPLGINILGEFMFGDPSRASKAVNLTRQYRQRLREMDDVSFTDLAVEGSQWDQQLLTDAEVAKLVVAWRVARHSPAMPETGEHLLLSWAYGIRCDKARLDDLFAGVVKPAVDEDNQLSFVETTETERQQLLRAFETADSPSADAISDPESVQLE